MKLDYLRRIDDHPIIREKKKSTLEFLWNGKKMKGFYGETISSALIANNVDFFGYHHKDKSPQGMFCANGQCSQCMVLANDVAVKSCMTKIENNMQIKSLEGLPSAKVSKSCNSLRFNSIIRYYVSVLVIGGGPAGLSAAIELGNEEVDTIVLDDKDRLGGKLLLQTHKFFGSVGDSFAGTRGFSIAKVLEGKVKKNSSIKVWLNSTVVGVFSDKVVGVLKDGEYKEIVCKKMLVATGAREKMISFPGNTLPGVYGAGAFQTMINRDLVRPSEKILIVGSGNVGLITAYHAIQSGIDVEAVIEIQKEIGGYKVHYDKIIKMGIPVYKRHKILYASGINKVTSVVIVELDSNDDIKFETQKKYYVDTILIAAGLNSVNEFYYQACKWGMEVYSAGDSREIAEASAAMFSGKIEGQKIIISLKGIEREIPTEWYKKMEVLRSGPKNTENKIELVDIKRNREISFLPVFHCYQEIPCNPCSSVCPENVIKMSEDKITGIPYLGKYDGCKGCMSCVYICPGLAITVIDKRKSTKRPTVTLPYEMDTGKLKRGSRIQISDILGSFTDSCEVKRVMKNKKFPGTMLIQLEIDNEYAEKNLGIKLKENKDYSLVVSEVDKSSNMSIVCRCERITAVEIRSIISSGITDINQIKSITRVGMGACGSKNCHALVWQIFKEEKIEIKRITDRTVRPLFVEVPIGVLAGKKEEINES